MQVAPSSKLSLHYLRKMATYVRTRDGCFPVLGWSMWRHIACGKLQLPEELAWLYFETFDLFVGHTPEERLEWAECLSHCSCKSELDQQRAKVKTETSLSQWLRLPSNISSDSLELVLHGDMHPLLVLFQMSANTLQFLIFLYIQQLNHVSLRTSLIGEEWPSHRTRSSSASDREAKTSSQNKVVSLTCAVKSSAHDVNAYSVNRGVNFSFCRTGTTRPTCRLCKATWQRFWSCLWSQASCHSLDNPYMTARCVGNQHISTEGTFWLPMRNAWFNSVLPDTPGGYAELGVVFGGLVWSWQSCAAGPQAADQRPPSDSSWLLHTQPFLSLAQAAHLAPTKPHSQSVWNNSLFMLWEEAGVGPTR